MTRCRQALALVAALAAAVVIVPAIGARPALAAPSGQNCAAPGQDGTPASWAQQLLAPDQAWPFTRGFGESVAVLDTGVDANQPELRGRVTAGFDALAGGGSANTDCAGTGTQVAGAIAGAPSGGSGVPGVAPGVTIVPVRVTNSQGGQSSATGPDATVLAKAINWAAGQRVSVIDISTPIYVDDPGVQAAVDNALTHNIVVVCAVGDQGAASGDNPPPFPASYPGVIGVGAIDPTGARWDSSGHGRYVSLVAPGVGVPVPQRGHGLVAATGTSIAAGFVSGVAALVRARFGQVPPAEVAQRLTATATPAVSGTSNDLGRGMVNPLAALTANVVGGAPVPLPAMRSGPDPAAEQWNRSRRLAVGLGLGGLLLVLAVLALAVAIPRGRRRAWRATLARRPEEREEPAEPGPPVLLFDEQPH